MGIFGDKKEEEREEVTIGLKDEKDENSNKESSGSAVDVGAVDFNENSQNQDRDSEKDKDLRRQVENKVASDSSSNNVDLGDIHEQNEQIKRKLDTIISSL